MPTSTTVPSLDDVNSQIEEQDRLFQEMLPSLLSMYEGQYVALLHGRIVGHGRDDEKLAGEMRRRFGGAPWYIGEAVLRPQMYELGGGELTD